MKSPKRVCKLSLDFCFLAFTGWNSAPIVEEIDSPEKNLPSIDQFDHFLWTVGYILTQVVSLKHDRKLINFSAKCSSCHPFVFENIFGPNRRAWISFFIAITMIATISVGYSWIGHEFTHRSRGKDTSLRNLCKTVESQGILGAAIVLNTLPSV